MVGSIFNTYFDWPRASPATRMVRFSGEGASRSFEEIKSFIMLLTSSSIDLHILRNIKRFFRIMTSLLIPIETISLVNYLASCCENLSVLEPYSLIVLAGSLVSIKTSLRRD